MACHIFPGLFGKTLNLSSKSLNHDQISHEDNSYTSCFGIVGFVPIKLIMHLF